MPTNACFFNTSTNLFLLWLACHAHQRLLFQPIHKFLLCTNVRPSKHSLLHCPPACQSCLPISVSGANLIFTNNCLVYETFQIRKTAGSLYIYINTLKELPGFREERVVIWLIQIVFVDHGFYIKKWVFDISENCDDEPSKPPWCPAAGVCAVYSTRPTMVYIPSES